VTPGGWRELIWAGGGTLGSRPGVVVLPEPQPAPMVFCEERARVLDLNEVDHPRNLSDMAELGGYGMGIRQWCSVRPELANSRG
jgi:hypothetical protein